jgi:hypothetical protein
MLSSPWKDVNSVLNKIGRKRGEEGSVIEIYENRRPRIKSLADYQDDSESRMTVKATPLTKTAFSNGRSDPSRIENSQPSKMMYRSKRVVATILDSQTNFATIALAPTPRAIRIRITCDKYERKLAFVRLQNCTQKVITTAANPNSPPAKFRTALMSMLVSIGLFAFLPQGNPQPSNKKTSEHLSAEEMTVTKIPA